MRTLQCCGAMVQFWLSLSRQLATFDSNEVFFKWFVHYTELDKATNILFEQGSRLNISIATGFKYALIMASMFEVTRFAMWT